MNREESVTDVSSQKRLKGASSEIAQKVFYWMFEYAEANAERIANHDLQDPSDDTDDLRRSMAQRIYYNAEEEIETVLGQNGLTQYQGVVKQVCIEELSERFDELLSRFGGTGRPGPAELAIEEAAKPSKTFLADSLLVAFAEPDRIAERQRRADEQRRRRANEWRQLRSQKRSRGWLSAVRDFFSW